MNFGSFKSKKVREKASGDVGNMSNRLGADANPGPCPEFFQVVSNQFPFSCRWLWCPTVSGAPR